MRKYYGGIDIGFSGAICRLNSNTLGLEFWKMPIMKKSVNGKEKSFLDKPNLVLILNELKKCDSYIVAEEIHSQPTDGHNSAFSFGRQLGTLDAFFFLLDIPYFLVPPPEWKKAIIGKSAKKKEERKALSLATYSRIFNDPEYKHIFPSSRCRVPSDDYAEAALLAYYGMLLGL